MKPPRIVLDTNVLVSAFLNPFGNPGIVLRHVENELVILLLDERILMEYRNVLRRPKFNFDEGLIDETVSLFDRLGEFIVSKPLDAALPDPDDLPFLEVAVSGKTDALITGNTDKSSIKTKIATCSTTSHLRRALSGYDLNGRLVSKKDFVDAPKGLKIISPSEFIKLAPKFYD